MLRRGLVQLMAFLLVALPLLGVLPNDTHAASSRIAVIKEMSGDVKVKKSGGSKAFRAFAKLSLKQGDILTTGEDGEATLIFSNGSSSDDSMTVSSDTTLTFSKLSSKGGSVTKVSMLKGSVWSDVKSIKTKDDEFQLETPTAVMGVRGTDFFTTVSSLTGSTDMFVFAGVVQAALSSFPFPGSGESNEQLSLVYPAQQIFLPGLTSLMSPLVTYADLNSIIEHATDSLIKAMLLSKEKIDQENQDLIDKLKLDGNIPPELIGLDPSIGLDPTDYIQKLESLLSSAVQGAVDSNKITDQDLARLIEQVNQDMGTPVELSDEKYELSQNQKQKLEELRKKQLEEQQAALEKKKQQVNDALYSMIQQLRQNMQNLNSINQALLEKLQKQTESKLTSGMSDAEKAAYEAAKSQNQGTPPATTQPSTTPSQSNNSLLDQLELTGAELSPAFDAATTAYETSVANGVSELEVKASAQDARASVQVNETALTDAGLLVPLNVGSNEISVVVTAENGSKTTYTIAVTRAEAPPSGTSTLSSLTLSSGTLSPAFAPDVASYTTSVSSGTESVTVTPVATDENATVTVDGENLTDGSRTVALNYGDNTIQIKVTAEDGQTQKVYTVQAVRQLINQVDIQFPAGSPVSIDFTSSNPSQEINVPSDADSLDLKVPGDGPSLTITANGTEITPEPVYVAAVASLPDPVAWSYHIPLTAGVNTIEVTALIDGLSKTYTIIANKPLPSDTGLTSLQVVETGGSMTYDAAADGDTWSVRIPASWTAASLKFVPADPSAKLVLNDQEYASGDLVPLTLTADGVSFQMKAADGTIATYQLTIRTNHVPTATDATQSTVENTSIEGSLAALDEDGDPLTFQAEEQPLHGSLSLQPSGSYTYTPNEGYTGEDYFTYTLSDGMDVSAKVKISIAISAVNHAPSDITFEAQSLSDVSAVNSVAGTFGAVDEDSDDTFAYELVSGEGDTDNANFQVDGTELQTKEPLPAGEYSVRVKVTDAGGLTFERSLSVTVLHAEVVLSSNVIDYDVEPGTVVGDLSVSNAGEGNFTFALTSDSENPDCSDNSWFQIVKSQLSVGQGSGFEDNSLHVCVQATGEGDNPVSIVTHLTILIRYTPDLDELRVWEGSVSGGSPVVWSATGFPEVGMVVFTKVPAGTTTFHLQIQIDNLDWKIYDWNADSDIPLYSHLQGASGPEDVVLSLQPGVNYFKVDYGVFFFNFIVIAGEQVESFGVNAYYEYNESELPDIPVSRIDNSHFTAILPEAKPFYLYLYASMFATVAQDNPNVQLQDGYGLVSPEQLNVGWNRLGIQFYGLDGELLSQTAELNIWVPDEEGSLPGVVLKPGDNLMENAPGEYNALVVADGTTKYVNLSPESDTATIQSVVLVDADENETLLERDSANGGYPVSLPAGQGQSGSESPYLLVKVTDGEHEFVNKVYLKPDIRE